MTNIEALFPFDGPHTPDRVKAAARAVEDLVRYLANATRRAKSVGPPDTLYLILTAIHQAADRLPQVLNQVAAHIDWYATLPGLYDGQGGDPLDVASGAAADLHGAAYLVGQAAIRIGRAHEAVSRLGVRGVR